jgi:hypothetical protein
MSESRPLVQIDDIVREMNDEEFAAYTEEQSVQQALEAEKLAKAEARTSALAKLAALGLTEEEIAAL